MKTAIVCTLLMGLLATGIAFQCKQCMHIHTDNDDVNDIMDQAMAGASLEFAYTDKCGDDAASITSSECEEGQNACVSMKMQAHMDVQDTEIKMTMYMRLCAADVSESDKGCHDLGQYEDLMKQSMGGQDASNLKDVGGVACACDQNNCNDQRASALSKGDIYSDASVPLSNPMLALFISCLLALIF